MTYNNIILVISAPSGTGKSSVIDGLIGSDSSFSFIVSTTTRKQRENETNGTEYYFVLEDEFKKKIERGEFIEWAFVHQHYYGTTKKEVDRIIKKKDILVFDVDVHGVKNLKNKIEDAIFILIIPPSLKTLRERLEKRGTDSEDSINIRINDSKAWFNAYELYDYILENDKIDNVISNIKAIVIAEKSKTHRKVSLIKAIMEDR